MLDSGLFRHILGGEVEVGYISCMDNTVFVVLMNLLILVVGAVAFVVLKWSGLGFAFGCIVGGWFFFIYFRLKHGYWA